MRRPWLIGFRRRYGAGPVHLAAHLLGFAIVVVTFGLIFSGGGLPKLLVLYVGFVIAHDLIFVPAYAGMDRVMRAVLARVSLPRRMGVPLTNHVRVPALISALLLIIYAPLISGTADGNYFALTGHHLEHYLRNWLLITGALFLGSGVIYLARVGRLKTRGRKAISVGSDVEVWPSE